MEFRYLDHAMYDSDSIPIGQVITKLFNNLEQSQVENGLSLLNVWKKILCSIDYDGAKLACHTSVVELKNDNLLVEVDHPGWGQILSLHKKYILRGLAMHVPQLTVRNIFTRVKGQTFTLPDFPQTKTQSANSEDFAEKNIPDSAPVSQMPDELNKMFADMRNSLLTKQSNQ